ncbi:MAG: DUF342 domain-containing protein, partial [Calditrichia bacterium]|nr:DUF342 domain-containing protein [Calditrichia bacterium]
MPIFESTNILLTVDDAWLTAQAQFKSFTDNKALVAELTELLKTNGIVTINKYNVKKALLEKDTKTKYMITNGIKPVNGKKEHFKFLIDITKKPKPVKKEDGSVDFKQLIIPNLVKSGQKVMEKIPDDPGTPGKTIKGESITPTITAVKTVKPTNDLKVDPENPNIYLADKSGLIVIEENVVKITTRLVINGNVDFSTGSVNFPGSVRVAGDLKSGFSVEADGDVEIQGTVEDSELIVGGNLTIKFGFTGTGNGKITCKNDVKLGYAVNQKIECKNLKFLKEIVNCDVKAENEVLSDFGKVISGRVQAGMAINVNQVGHEESAAAQLIVGSSSELAEKKKELEEK